MKTNKALTPTQLREKLQQTLAFHKNGQLNEAIDGYELIIPHLAGNNQILLQLLGNIGAIYMSLGRNQDAQRHFEHAIELDSKNAQAHFNLAVILTSKLNQHAKALKHCALAIKFDDQNYKAYHLMGNIMQNLGKDSEAERYYGIADNLAKELDPNYVSISTTGDSAISAEHNEDVEVGYVRKISQRVFSVDQPAASASSGLQIQLHSTEPLVLTVDDFLSSEECDYIVAKSKAMLQPSFTMGNSVKLSDTYQQQQDGGSGKSDSSTIDAKFIVDQEDSMLFRSSYNTWLSIDEKLQSIQMKLSELLKLPLPYIQRHSEDLQVVRYFLGGQFKVHQDSSAFHSRLCTILFYLNDISAKTSPASEGDPDITATKDECRGGGTWFPYASSITNEGLSTAGVENIDTAVLKALNTYEAIQDSKEPLNKTLLPGVTVEPKKGRVAIFFNYRLSDDQLDPLAVHAGLPLELVTANNQEDMKNCRPRETKKEDYEKWVANYWIKFDKSHLQELY